MAPRADVGARSLFSGEAGESELAGACPRPRRGSFLPVRIFRVHGAVLIGRVQIRRGGWMERLREWLPVLLGLAILVLVMLGLEVPA